MRMERPDWRQALERSGLLPLAASRNPRVVGTLPIGVAVPSSDIDVLCELGDADKLCRLLWLAYADCDGFGMHRWSAAGRPLVTRFVVDSWPFEVFASSQPVQEQPGWRHFEVERRLLALGGATFRDLVIRHRAAGLKTEPAFAAALGSQEDPYRLLLALYDAQDRELLVRLKHGPLPGPPPGSAAMPA